MADRGLSAGAITNLGASTVEMYHLLRIDFSTPVYYTTAPYDITYDDGDGSQTYLSVGTLLRVPDATESLKIKPQTISVSLSGAQAAVFSLLLSEDKNADTYITKYIVASSEGVLIFKGSTDFYTTTENVKTGDASVKLSIANHWSNWEARAGTYLSDEEQQRLYSGDLGLEFSKITDFFLPYWGDNGTYDYIYTEQYLSGLITYNAFGYNVTSPDILGSAIADASDMPDTIKLPVVYGEVALKGIPVFRTITNQQDDIMWVVYALAEGECDSLVDITFNGISYTDAKISPYVSASFYPGTTTQAADATLISESTLWTSAHQLKGICYVAIRYELNDIWGGDPNPTFQIKGKKLYDPRTTLTVYSQNPALVLYDYLTNTKYGKSIPAAEIDGITAGANYCESQVYDHSGGSQQYINLFECHGTLDTGEVVKTNVEKILFTMRGHLPWISGKYTLVIERDDDTSVYSITEDEITDTFMVKEAGNKALANVMYYAIIDGETGQPYEVVSESSAYQTTDGRELKKSIKNRFENNRYRAQNRADTELKKTRQTITVEMTCGNSESIQIETGDVVDITRTVQGWSAKEFRVTSMILKNGGAVQLFLHEYEPTVYDWSIGVETTPPSNTTLPNPLDLSAPTSLVLTSGTSVLMIKDDGTIVSRIKATWTTTASFSIVGYNVYIESPTDAAPVFYTYVKGADSDEVFIDNVEDGVSYTVYIHSVNSYGAESTALSDSEVVVGKTAVPANVTGFVVAPNGDSVVFKWNQVSDLDLAGYEIRYGGANVTSWEDGTPLTSVTRGTSVTSADVPPGTWTFYVKAVDTSGNYSAIATSISDVLVETVRDVIFQVEQSPFIEIEDATNIADNFSASFHSLEYVTASKIPTKTYKAEVSIAKDSTGAATRFCGLYIWFDGTGVYESAAVHLDTSDGDYVLVGSNASAEVIELTDYWFVRLSFWGSDLDNTDASFGLWPAVGANADLTTTSATATGSIEIFRPAFFEGETQLIGGVFRFHEWVDVYYDVVVTDNGVSAPVELTPVNTNFVVHHTGKLIPQSQETDSDDGATIWADDTVFEDFVNNPYATCTYTAPEIDISFDDYARAWGSIDSYLGPGETGIANPKLSLDYRIDGGSYDGFEDWAIGSAEARYFKHKLTLTTSEGVAVISSFIPTVDQLEHTQRDSNVAVASGGSTITFDTPFHVAPHLTAIVIGSSAKFVLLENITPTSFDVILKTSGGGNTTGIINWEATGI